MLRASAVRIRRERWRRSAVGEYAISVDKMQSPVREVEKTRRIEAIQNRRKKTLASVSGLCKTGILTSLLLQFSVSRRPASAGFLFSRS